MAALGPEVITQIGDFKITNTLLTTLVVDAVLLALVFFVSKNIKTVPGKLQSIFETGISYFYNLAKDLSGDKAGAIFPWVMTFFIVIFATNILGLLPGVGSVGFFPKEEHATQTETTHQEKKVTITTEEQHAGEEKVTDEHGEPVVQENTASSVKKDAAAEKTHEEESAHGAEFIPLFRPSTSDFNATLALAFVSLIATHALSIKYTGWKDYLTRFFSLNPILLFVGVLELVSEFIKMFSLSFRLFGNIYAGEVALHTVSTVHPLSAFVAPIPFLLLESIVAIVQALVFAMLTMVFMSILITPHHAEGGEHH